MTDAVTDTCCGGGCKNSCISAESIIAIRYTLRQAADAVRANEKEMSENMIHKALEELEKYTGD
jgi:ribosome recycling factor